MPAPHQRSQANHNARRPWVGLHITARVHCFIGKRTGLPESLADERKFAALLIGMHDQTFPAQGKRDSLFREHD